MPLGDVGPVSARQRRGQACGRPSEGETAMTRTRLVTRRVAVLAIAAIALAACTSSKSNTTSTGNGGTGGAGGSAAALAKAKAATQLAFKGTNRNVDSQSRPAAKNKSVYVISAGQAASSSSVPSNGAMAAGQAIGWNMHLLDAKLDPSNYPSLVRQAIAAKADGIVLDAIDCSQAKQPLEEAKAAHIVTVPIYAFDCDDAHAGGGGQPLYSANINYGPRAANVDAFTESYGADQANYIIASSNNQAKIIAIQDPEFTVLYWTLQGFKNVIDASGTSQIVSTLNVTTQDLGNGQITTKIQAELLKHPEANWVKSPYTYVTTLGIAPSLGSRAGKIDVMGGEGFSDELDLIRTGKITAANVISSEWVGWASIDTMNSVFIGQKPVDSGIGWTMVDKDHNLPPSGNFVPSVDFKAEYKKAWGVS
jgi:ribose transport system substrate-binding protein